LQRTDVVMFLCVEKNESRLEDPDPEEGYTLFWRSQSPFSQWHSAYFTVDDITYNCAEQYMMYQKAGKLM